ADRIRETEREAAALRERLTAARERHEREAAMLQQAAEQRASSAEAAKTAAARQREAAERLEARLAPEGFREAGELREACLGLAHKAELAAEIERYREAAGQLAAQIGHLREVLQGRTVSDEEWRLALESLQAAKAGSE